MGHGCTIWNTGFNIWDTDSIYGTHDLISGTRIQYMGHRFNIWDIGFNIWDKDSISGTWMQLYGTLDSISGTWIQYMEHWIQYMGHRITDSISVTHLYKTSHMSEKI